MRFVITLASWAAQALYAVIKAVSPVRHKVAILSRQSDTPSKDILMLVKELRARDAGLEVVVRCRFIEPALTARIAYVGEIVAQLYHLATARVCVVDGYVIPVSLLTHRPGLYIVQMWHALGAIKRFGYQSLDRPGGRSSALARSMRMHHNYDAVLCGGPSTVDVFAAAFDTEPERVLPIGLPRVDYLLEHRDDAVTRPPRAGVAAIRECFPLLADESRRVILYAPTFRKNRPDHYLEVIECFSEQNVTLVVKPHPLVTTSVSGANVVVASDVDVLDLLPLCSAVITDYSAVAFEALVLDKPIYFYVCDIDDYRAEHGLNIDLLEELPQATSRSIEQIAEWIREDDYNRASIAAFKQRYLSVAAGGCTHAIAELVLGRVAGARR